MKIDIDKFIPKGSDKLIDPIVFMENIKKIEKNIKNISQEAESKLIETQNLFADDSMDYKFKKLKEEFGRLQELFDLAVSSLNKKNG